MTLDFMAHLRADSARFLEVLEDVDPATPVPSCPDWTAADLLWHLGEVQQFWGTIVRDRVQDPGTVRDAERPDGYPALVESYRAASSELARAIDDTPDEVEVWTWFDADHTAGFIRRRQAHEALVHRLDAELTAGAVTGFDADLATDGALEVLEWMYSGVPEWATPGDTAGQKGAVSTTDTGAHWLVRLGSWSGTSPGSGRTYADEPTITVVGAGDPTFEVSATARDLDAWLWNRPTLGDVDVSGDADRFAAIVRGGVH